MSRRSCLLSITLDGIKPRVGRTFVVPADITLDRLHDVIQIVMGWQDYHLHEFIIDGNRYTDEPESPENGEEEGRFRLRDLVRRKGTTFGYHYDFGESWMHTLVVETTNHQLAPRDVPIHCRSGERACPPEDVGGIEGYRRFCKVMADDGHAEHLSYRKWYEGLDWYKKPFDSERFDLVQINLELLKYLRWSRPRLIPWGAW